MNRTIKEEKNNITNKIISKEILQRRVSSFTGNREELENLYLNIKNYIKDDLINHIETNKTKIKVSTSFLDEFKKMFLPTHNKCYNNSIIYKNKNPNYVHVIGVIIIEKLNSHKDIVLHCYMKNQYGYFIDPTFNNHNGLTTYLLSSDDKDIDNIELEKVLTSYKINLLKELNNDVVNLALEKFDDFYDCL